VDLGSGVHIFILLLILLKKRFKNWKKRRRGNYEGEASENDPPTNSKELKLDCSKQNFGEQSGVQATPTQLGRLTQRTCPMWILVETGNGFNAFFQYPVISNLSSLVDFKLILAEFSFVFERTLEENKTLLLLLMIQCRSTAYYIFAVTRWCWLPCVSQVPIYIWFW